MKMRSGLLTLLTALLILPNISHAADPLLVDAVGTATNGNDTPSDPALNGFIVYLPQPTLAGNAVICGVTYPYSSSRTLSITDDKSDTWSKAVSVNNTNGNSEAIYYVTNVPAGMDKITFKFDAAILGFQVACKEAYNIVGTSALDGTKGVSALSGPAISVGALTTTTSNDLIFQYGDYDSGTIPIGGNQTATGFTDGSGFSRIIADTSTGEFFQNVLQTTAGSITPSYSVSGASNSTFGTVAAAFKTSSSAGTLPPSSGIHIDHEWTVDLGLATAFKATFPTDGDFTSIAITNAAWTGYKVSDSLSNSYTQSAPAYEGGVIGRLFYAVNPNVSLDQTITLNNNSGGNTEYVIRDIRGVATSSPLDTATAVAIQQTNFNNGSTISGGTITPSQPNELIILAQVNGFGPPLGVTSPTGAITDNVWATGETDADWFDLGEGHAHYFATGTSAISFTWTMENNVSGTSGGGNDAGTALWAIKAGSAPAITYGDLNGAANGAVTIYDAELVAQYVVGLITLTPAQIQEAEVSSTTETAPSIYDAFLIAEYAVGLITQFPVQ